LRDAVICWVSKSLRSSSHFCPQSRLFPELDTLCRIAAAEPTDLRWLRDQRDHVESSA